MSETFKKKEGARRQVYYESIKSGISIQKGLVSNQDGVVYAFFEENCGYTMDELREALTFVQGLTDDAWEPNRGVDALTEGRKG